MTDFTSVFDEAGDSAEEAVSKMAMATAMQASAGTQQFLFLAKDESDFNHRVALAEDALFKAAVAANVSPEDLVAEHKRQFGLVLEAKKTVVAADDNHVTCPNHEDQSYNKSTGDCSCGSNHHRWASPNNPGGYKKAGLGQTCPGCNGSRAVPAQGHESYGEVSNGQVRCPDCHGHGVVAAQPDGDQDSDDRTSYERYGDVGDGLGDPGDAQDDWYDRHLGSLKQALEEGQDPLEWLEQEGAGEGQAEKPSEAGIEALTNGGKAEAAARPFDHVAAGLSKEAFDWLKKNPTSAPAAPAEDPLAGRATCPCGSRTTAPMRDGTDKHKCFNCDSVFKAASLVQAISHEEGGPSDYGWPGDDSGIDRSESDGPKVHTFGSTGEAYDHSQTSDHIKDGDILHVPSEGVTGFLNEAWPVALHHGESGPGEFHGVGGGYTADQVFRGPDAASGKDYSATLDKAREVHEGSQKQAATRPF